MMCYQTRDTGDVVDIMHYHISGHGKYQGNWSKAKRHYRDIMRDPDNINYVTVLRDPRSHLIRYYCLWGPSISKRQSQNELSTRNELLDPPAGVGCTGTFRTNQVDVDKKPALTRGIYHLQ